jgi:phytoene dehydrogenase-like protein
VYDVVIIGAGHNGLTAAAYLAAAGLKVVVLEKNAHVGGAAYTEEFHPGFRNSVAAYTVSLLNPKIIRELELHRHGLKIVERPVANFWPVDERRALVMPYGLSARQRAIAAFSERDAALLPEYDAALDRAAAVLKQLILETPPNAGGGLLELWKGARLSRSVMKLPLETQRDLAALFTESATDFLSRWFENETVKAAFAFDGIVGTYAAPSTPGTAYVLLHHCFGEVNGKPGIWGHAIGGMGAITAAIAGAAREKGVEIRNNVEVREVAVANGRASGVVLASGEVVRARAVAAAVPPKLLFSRLVPAGAIDSALHARLANLKSGSGTFRMNVALSELPDFTCKPNRDGTEHLASGIVIGPTLDYLERAYLDARSNGWSKEPVVEILIPSMLDETLAPKGRHVASLFVQHVAPHLPTPRSWADPKEKETFADLVIETVTRRAPNFKASVLARQVLSPLDLEQRFGLIDGDIFHGALSLDQLFSLRPTLGHADYRMPLPGLYLCASGAHPGGGVTGVPGHNAAREIIRDRTAWWKGRT